MFVKLVHWIYQDLQIWFSNFHLKIIVVFMNFPVCDMSFTFNGLQILNVNKFGKNQKACNWQKDMIIWTGRCSFIVCPHLHQKGPYAKIKTNHVLLTNEIFSKLYTTHKIPNSFSIALGHNLPFPFEYERQWELSFSMKSSKWFINCIVRHNILTYSAHTFLHRTSTLKKDENILMFDNTI